MFVSLPDFKSSNIISMRYDLDSKVLEVEFKKSRIYHYLNVPKNVFSELNEVASRGESVGKAFNSLILSSGFEYQEVGG